MSWSPLKIGLTVLVGAVLLVGVMRLGQALNPLNWFKPKVETVQAQLQVQTQQAESNAAGAAINDKRAGNIDTIRRTGQEARHAVQQTEDYDARLGVYLDRLDRLRDASAAPIGDVEADGRGHDQDR